MIETLVILGIFAVLGIGFYLRRTMPWPFEYEGRKYRRMPDGTFQDATRQEVLDIALISKLMPAYEAAKYGSRDLQSWDYPDNS